MKLSNMWHILAPTKVTGVGKVVAVKPETDPVFLRERALFVLATRRALGLPVNVRVPEIRQHIPHLVVHGGKPASASHLRRKTLPAA